jgi:DNA polymerase V
MYALVDCNNFYASCERVFRPDLVGKPVVVLSNNDGCVIARSNEAKEVGIPMGAVYFKFKKLLEEKNVHVFSANFRLYGDMSNRVMNILGQYCPEIEIYSIDEAFMKFEGFENIDLKQYGNEIRAKILKWTGIPISIGFAPTKALSKVANRIAKKYAKETGNVHLIDTEEKRLKALKWLKVEDIWGIGRQQAKLLNAQMISTAFEFTQMNDEWIQKRMSIVTLRLKKDLEGIPTLTLDDVSDRKNIAVTRSFEEDYTTFEEVKERIVAFSVMASEKLRKQKSFCRSVMVFIRSNKYKLGKDEQYRNSFVYNMPFATNSSIEIATFATKALENIFLEGYLYKKAGVILMDFTTEKEIQVGMFENSNPKHQKLMKAIDSLHQSIGEQKIKFANQDLNRIWKMNQNKISPNYSTSFDAFCINADK